jgi:hypothetical protein
VSSGSEAEAEAWGAKLLQAAFPSAVDVSGNGILQAQQHTTPDGQVRSRKNMYTCVYIVVVRRWACILLTKGRIVIMYGLS